MRNGFNQEIILDGKTYEIEGNAGLARLLDRNQINFVQNKDGKSIIQFFLLVDGGTYTWDPLQQQPQ